MAFNINQRVNGLEPLSYIGVNAVQPPDFVTKPRPPNGTDSKNFYLGTIWLDTTGYPTTLPKANNVWMLVALVGNTATWINFGNGMLNTLTGNSGGPVSPDGADNINVVGDGTTITVAGNPGTHTLTASVVGTGVVSTLTGNSGGAVHPLAGNINVVGDGATITIAGNPGTHTLTASFIGGGTFVTTLHTDDGNNVTPTAGVINLHGTHGLNTTGTVGPNTATVQINNAITLGDLANLGAGVAALNAQTGDITITANAGVGNLNLATTTNTGNAGVITQGGTGGANRFIHGFGAQNFFAGPQAGNFTLLPLTAEGNTGVGQSVLSGLTQGVANTCMGRNACDLISTGVRNTGIGYDSIFSLTTGSENTAIGYASLFATQTGSFNCALGDQSLFNLGNGSYNIAVGYTAGGQYSGTESSNIIITSDINIGTAGESNVIRIGSSGAGNAQQNKCFVAAIRGITTVNNNAIAVLIDSAGQLGTVSSSRKVKDNINDMGSYSNVLYRLRPVTFNYKNHSPESISVGLIAEEVYQVAPQLVVHTKDGDIESVKYHDLVPMLLNELHKLKERIDILEEELL